MIMIEGTRNSCTLLAGLWFETFGTYTLRSTSTKMRNQNGCVSSFRAFPLPPSNKISVLRGVSFVDPNLAKHSIDRDQKESNKTNLHTQGLREEGTVNSIQVNSIQAAKPWFLHLLHLPHLPKNSPMIIYSKFWSLVMHL
jgi:hypothetical protein